MHATVKTLAAVSAVAVSLGVAAAAVPQVAQAAMWYGWNGPNPSPQFRAYLAKQYFMLADGEDQDWETSDSNYLRSAGVAALNGHPILPHPLEDVHIVSSAPGELEGARNFLLNVARNGAAEKMPGAYARALSSFDCWVEEQEAEPNASHNTQQCKIRYMRNANLLSSLAGTTTTTTVVEREKLRTLHSVYFAWNKYDLTPQAREKLQAARTMLSDVNNGKLIITGYADTSGSAAYNQKLSEKRAQTVANYLQLPADRFEVRVRGFGERNLPVPTADGVRKPENRVVDISVRANRYSTTTETQQQ
ncbi:MAG TPA: OmpA family protein [Alphaproteobacteria bacterium]|nr:OmpA family protein [Alphaproteobacteria bacterium]